MSKKINKKNENTKLDLIEKILYYSGIYLLATFAVLLIITALGWFMNINISVLHLPISFILSLVIMIIIPKKDKKNFLISVLLSIIIFVICMIFSSFIYDQSYDGNSYHKEAVGLMSLGYNPVKDNVNDFCEKNNLPDTVQGIWIEHYPKATWIYGASIYKITNNIETGKSYNLLICYITFALMSTLLASRIKNKTKKYIICFLSAFTPIMACQVFSYYLDGFLGELLILLILCMIKFYKDQKDIINYILIFSILVIIINLKFTGLALAGMFCLGIYIYYIVNNIKNKTFKEVIKPTIFFIVIVIVSVCIVGYTSYVTNTISHKHPFYPLFGEGKIDIMTSLQPASFKEKNAAVKSFESMFSKTANIGVFNNGEPEYKIPFTFSKNEIKSISEDTRIGGFGIFFSGIFIISIIIIGYKIIMSIKKKDKDINVVLVIIPLITIIGLMLFLSDGWWARYSPQIYLFPIFALVFLAMSKDKKVNILFYVFALLIFGNSFVSFAKVTKTHYTDTKEFKNQIALIGKKDIIIMKKQQYFDGILFNLDDEEINYTLVDYIDERVTLYGDFLAYKYK